MADCGTNLSLKLRAPLAGLTFGILAAAPAWSAPAVILDGSFGASGPLLGPNYIITAGMGRQVGTNLFHSFSQFDLINGQSATFTATGSTGTINNIIARVTSGAPSSIDGTINSSITGANLFFLNPAGVMFGSHAQVNVPGAFVVSTADYLQLADGGKFNARLGDDSMLTTASVSAFGFLSAPNPVSFSGSQIAMNAGSSFHVISGNISLDNATISAPSANLTLFSAASAGVLPFDLTTAGSSYGNANFSGFGQINLQHRSKLSIDGAGGGHLVIRGGQLVVNNSVLSSANSGASAGGAISVQGTAVTIQNGGTIGTSTSAAGTAGAVSVQGDSLDIEGLGVADTPFSGTGIFSSAVAGATGGSGAITVNVAQALTLNQGGRISDTTYSTAASGIGGNVSISAASMSITGVSIAGNSSDNAGIFSESHGAAQGGALGIDVNQDILIGDSGALSTSCFASGAGGAMTIEATNLTIQGSAADLKNNQTTGIFANSKGASNLPNAGDVTLTLSGNLTMDTLARIASRTFGTGNGGDITISAANVSLTHSSIISAGAETAAPASLAHAGAVNVMATGNVNLATGGEIETDTLTSGAAGDIAVTSATLSINGTGDTTGTTGIESNTGQFNATTTTPTAGTGNAGAITVVTTGQATITSSGTITTNSFSDGKGGQVSVHAGNLTINGTGDQAALPGVNHAGIYAETHGGTGADAGSLTIIVDQNLQMQNEGAISSSTFTAGNAGSISLQAGTVTIDGTNTSGGTSALGTGHVTGLFANSTTGYIVGDTALGNAGTITATVTNSLDLLGNGRITARSFGSSNGGSITIMAGSMSVAGPGQIAAGAELASSSSTAHAGTIAVTTTGALSLTDGGQIETDTLTSGNAGDITVNAGTLLIDGTGDTTGSTGIASNTGKFNPKSTTATAGTGQAGSINVTVTGQATITASGTIATNSFSDGQGGNVTVSAGNLTINGTGDQAALPGVNHAGIYAETHGGAGANAGSLTINVDQALMMQNEGSISSSTYTSGEGGSISVTAGTLTIDGTQTSAGLSALGTTHVTGLFANGATGYIKGDTLIGDAGQITVHVTGSIDLLGNGRIATRSFGQGNGGTITITAESLDLSGPSLIAAGAEFANATSTSHAGTISIETTDGISLSNGGQIETNTLTSGSAGDVMITIDSGNLTIDGTADPSGFTGISSSSGTSAFTKGSGAAGNIVISVPQGSVNLIDGGGIVASTYSLGNGGNVDVSAQQVVISGATSSTSNSTGLLAQTFGSGAAGSIQVTTTNLLSIFGDGGIQTSTFGGGFAGDIDVTAGTILLNGGLTATAANYQSGIISISNPAKGQGTNDHAGVITVNATGTLTIEQGAQISVATKGKGKGGAVSVSADTLEIVGLGAGSSNQTGILGDAFGSGQAGDVTVNVSDSINLDLAGQISSSSFSTLGSAGNGGNVTITCGGDINLYRGSSFSASSLETVAGSVRVDSGGMLAIDSGSSITTNSAGVQDSGGNITLKIEGLLYMLDGSIAAQAAGGTGSSGGNILIDPTFVVLNNSTISANDPGGTGGTIQIITGDLFNEASAITATGSTNGTITTPPPDLNLASSLIVQPADLENTEKQLRESCARSLNHEFSSLIVVGRGGVEPSPEELQSDFGTGLTVFSANGRGKN